MDAASFKHVHSQTTQELIDIITTMGPTRYTHLVNTIMEAFALDGLAETSLEGLLTRDIFAFGAAELYMRVREKVEIVAELEGAEEDE